MANERKTENIIRSHFEQFKDLVGIEEQASDIPKINKLLKTASKKGGGKGKPEFLITFKINSNLLIVIECKADVSKHESNSRDKFSDYAVDGALLYSSYLSKEFDILAIAISGEDAGHLKVSHFLQLKNEKKAIPIFGDKLLTAQNYLDGYLKSPEKFRQDYNTLLDFTKHLNEELHSNKIPERDRALLLSCILIALENAAFRASYKSHKTPQNLASALVQTVLDELESANIIGEKLENLDIQFSFIKTDTSLSTRNNVLENLIDEIDENINSFIKTHEYFDVLGQLYIEFLRYANSDKGLGIVLTPPHITELFSELAQVNKKTIVYDNCTGTGGFLISAMQKMIQDAKDDRETIKNIKANQLIGVEYQSHIFALAISNMYIHQDGKTNITKGSCFDKGIIEAVKKIKPTVGLLNPPYKADKKNDTEELEFILNNLDCLTDGGTCVAIVPMQSASAQTGKIYELKRQLLQKHTLEAVLSMPDELFFNSDVTVVSCIMVFTAHKPHPKNKETYFGYYKDDGFVKRKIKGRVDLYGKWDAIKEKWISYFINRKNEAGFSINKVISAEDEWSAEAYMETGYQGLSDKQFIKKLLDYSTFLFFNQQKSVVSNNSYNQGSKIKLSLTNWQFFKLVDLFNISSTRDELPGKLPEGTLTPYITSSELNNGITTYVDEESNLGSNTITANRGGSVGYFFYQPMNYMATPVDVRILQPKFQINPFSAMFLITILQMEKYRFNYSRKMGTDRLNNLSIKLPAKNGQPDFESMENYIKSLSYSKNI